jgi:hypothetical protein
MGIFWCSCFIWLWVGLSNIRKWVMLFWQGLMTRLLGSQILITECKWPLTLFLTLWFSVSAALHFSLRIFSSVGIEVLLTAVLNRRLLNKSDIQPHHLKRSYSVGMFGPAKQSSNKQSRNMLLVNSDVDIIGATQIAWDILSSLVRCIQCEKLMEM